MWTEDCVCVCVSGRVRGCVCVCVCVWVAEAWHTEPVHTWCKLRPEWSDLVLAVSRRLEQLRLRRSQSVCEHECVWATQTDVSVRTRRCLMSLNASSVPSLTSGRLPSKSQVIADGSWFLVWTDWDQVTQDRCWNQVWTVTRTNQQSWSWRSISDVSCSFHRFISLMSCNTQDWSCIYMHVHICA